VTSLLSSLTSLPKMQSLVALAAAALVCCAAIPASAAGDDAANSTLVLVHALFRHGDRTPTLTCPTDANTDAWLKQGLGQLTNKGKRMQYELGQFLRVRYGHFLHARYHRNYTHVRSSDVDRTLMSAQANLAGLYPPQKGDVWNPNLLWQPIPVHTKPWNEDLLLNFLTACERYAFEMERVLMLPENEQLLASFGALAGYVSKQCGRKIADLESLSLLYDLFLVERGHNMTLPGWATVKLAAYNNRTVFPDLLSSVNDAAFNILTFDTTLKRLSGGPLLQEIATNMMKKVHGDLEPATRQLVMFSGHDADLAAVMGALGVYSGIPPTLASCVLIELHRDATGGYFVQMFYRNETTHEPYPLTIPKCTAQCPWPAWRDLTTDVRPENASQECDRPSGRPNHTETVVIALATILALLLTVLAIGAVVVARTRRRTSLPTYSHFADVQG